MTLVPGAHLGPYRVIAFIGAGGMGEVYRARDTKLNRDVALKVLPDLLAGDPERLARFQREARVLASLNHSNIAVIHGLEEAHGVHALVLELVEGRTLAAWIAQGPIPLDEALPIAMQIAEALEAAHEQGIIHRDLKPANVKLRPDGTVKLLDFGLAKALESTQTGGDLSPSTTLTTLAATHMGVIVGTTAYMSPEQVKAKPVDRRTDIWGFGCLLYEMLTGRQAFVGETLSDAIAGILEREPDWRTLPEATPASIRLLLQRSLEKDPRRRLRDIGDARIELEETLAAHPVRASATKPVPAMRPASRPLLIGAVCLLAGLLASGIVSWSFRSQGPAGPVARFAVQLPPNEIVHPIGNSVAISRDGTRVAVVGNRDGRTQIYLRSVSELSAKRVPGTEGGSGPFFSPDGQWLAFRHAGSRTIRKVALSGGAPVTICSYNSGSGARWEIDDTEQETPCDAPCSWRWQQPS